MDTMIKELDCQSPLRAGDPNLSFLALQAVSELDSLLKGETRQLKAVCQLAARLRNSTADIANSAKRQSLMDPQAVQLFSEAYLESHGESVSTIDGLAREAWLIADEFDKVAETDGKGVVEKLRAFCLALSRIATSNRKAALNARSNKPYRS